MKNISKIKLLLYTTIFSNGGAERFILDLLNNINLEEFDITLVVGRKEGTDYLKFLKKDKSIKYINLEYSNVQDHMIFNKLGKTIEEINPDICFAPGIFTNFILLDAINTINYKGKIILRESNYISLRKDLLNDTYSKFKLYNQAAKVVSLTETLKDDLIENGVDKHKIVVIPSPIDIDNIITKSNIKENNKEFNNIKTRKIIHVGRLEYQKNHELLLRSFKRVTDTIKDVELVLIGKGSLEEELKVLCNNLNIQDKVHFLGFQDNPYYFIKNSDLLVLSSRYEGLPHVVLESLALKVPVLATDCLSGPRDILGDSKYGYLVKNNSVSALSKMMIKLLRNDELLNSKVEAAYERVFDYESKRVVSTYEDLFTKVVYEDPIADSYRAGGVKIGKRFSAVGPVNFGGEGYLIELGDDVRISCGVYFVTHDGGMHVIRQYKNIPADSFGKIKVGNNVFIGMNSIILKGVTIGDNVIIGAGSIVTKDIPSNSVVCGSPARVIETIDEYYEKNKDKIDLTKNMSAEEKREYLIKKFNI